MKEERYRKILDILEDKQYASVEELSQALFVSMPTIRRDLNEMQGMGLVTRSHGGAAKRSDDMFGQPLAFRSRINAGEKQRLARAAGELLRDDSLIYIDESSTVLHVIDQISGHKNITVLTNSMNALTLLMHYRIPSYCTGGALQADTMSLCGPVAEENIARFGIDTAFFSSSGINNHGYIVDYNERSTSLRRVVLRHAETKVFICDNSKFFRRGPYKLLPLDAVDYIVVNAPVPASMPTGRAKIIEI